MKRISVLFALLLALLLAAAGWSDWGTPTEALVSGPAEQEDGAVLAAENRLLTARVYTLREGRIVELYEESRLRDGEEYSIARVAAVGNSPCFMRLMDNGVDWQLVKLEQGKAVEISRGAFELESEVTDLCFRGDTCWITAIGKNGAVFVYQCTQTEDAALELILPAEWVSDAVSAEYDGEKIRVTTDAGDHCFITPTGERTYTDEASEMPLPKLDAGGAGWLLCKKTVLLAAALVWLAVVVTVLTARAISRRASRLATRLTAVGCAVTLLALLAAAGTVFWVVLVTGGLVAAWQAGEMALLAALIIWLLALVLLRSAAGRITRPVTALAQQMDRVSEGNVAAREPTPGKDELCRMDSALQMMCMNLSVWGYESVCTIRSYKRFVPEKMPELLERPVAEEIRLGDSRRMVGNVGVFSVGNRAEARNTLEDDGFVDFINHSFDIFHDCITDNHGWMLSSGLRLSAMEALFPDSPVDGVRAGLDFLGKVRGRAADGIPEPRACLILHRASFLYGIAGREERLFPYLSSAELDFLGSFTQRFDQAGVRIVVTQTYWEQMEDSGFSGRYIGFISDEDRGIAYKLFEILDAYPELEREVRRGYDQRFQEAIRLFYHNDFYLARNLFAALLRACPQDGIVRWYLFACEHFFNQGEAKADYRLFGIEE